MTLDDLSSEEKKLIALIRQHPGSEVRVIEILRRFAPRSDLRESEATE